MASSKKQRKTNRKRKLNEISESELPAAKRMRTSPTASRKMNIDALKKELLDKYQTRFPWTFFKFWEWIQSATPHNQHPCNVLQSFNIKLVGPFEYLHGDLSALSDEQILVHHRYYFDLPEFQTIAIPANDNDTHYGFWRDDPQSNPVGIVQSDSDSKVTDKVTKMIHPVAANLFDFALDLLAKNKDNPQSQQMQASLTEFIGNNSIKLEEDEANKLLPFKQREKKSVTKTFHGFGLVVPMRGDVGYRPSNYSVAELKKIFKRMHSQKSKGKKVDAEEMQYVMGNIPLADDEGDPGLGYEIGIDFFYSYPMFHDKSKRLLLNAYRLTNRHGFEVILEAHMKVRGTQNAVYNQLLSVQQDKTANRNTNANTDNRKTRGTQQKMTAFLAKDTRATKEKKKPKAVQKTLDDLSSESDS